jgi:hypothetical protein
MDLNEYDAPTPLNTDIDPRASQRVAAQHRAAAQPGRPSHDTEPIVPLRRAPQHLIVGIVGVIAIIGVLLLLASQQHTPALPLQLPTEPAQAFATDPVASPVAAQEARTAPAATAATIPAYAAPDGQLLGPIELDREIVAVAHFGTGWIQADVAGSGRVWLHAGDVPDIALIGPDLAPVAQTGRGLTLDAAATPEPPAAPEPTSPPAEPTSAPVVDAPLKVRAEDDCSAEHGRCDPPCTAEHGRCNEGDK